MPIKIEGLCGLTVKSNVLYALLPNCKVEKQSEVTITEKLLPHFPVILLQYDHLALSSKAMIQYQIEHPLDHEIYGVIFPNSEEVSFQFNGSPPLNTASNVHLEFIEMSKIFTNASTAIKNAVKLHSNLTDTSVSLQQIKAGNPGIDLACRVVISGGTLEVENPTTDEYFFNHSHSTPYNNRRKFHNILNVDAPVSGVVVGNKTFSFLSNTVPIIRIQNLPLKKIRPQHNRIDYDFELSYELIRPGFLSQLQPRDKILPTLHRQGHPAFPIICPLTWFETL